MYYFPAACAPGKSNPPRMSLNLIFQAVLRQIFQRTSPGVYTSGILRRVNMPNRIIKESICTSEQIDGLSLFEEVFFYRLIVNADDYGRFDARTCVLRARLFPLKETVDNEDVESALASLENAGLIARYTVDGRVYLFLPGWNRNQKVRSKRVKCPPPPGWAEGADAHKTADGDEQICADAQQTVSDCVPNPIQSESQSESESKSEQESERKERETIYNDNWRYSPRARSKTAQILVDGFHRAKLPCTEIRDLFTVVEHALELGIPPDEIALAANRMRATEFAAYYMGMDACGVRGSPNVFPKE